MPLSSAHNELIPHKKKTEKNSGEEHYAPPQTSDPSPLGMENEFLLERGTEVAKKIRISRSKVHKMR